MFVILEPVDSPLAQLAFFARLGEAIVIGAVLAWSFGALQLLTRSSAAFSPEQLGALLSMSEGAYGSGVQIWLMFFSLGSTLSFYLFFRSRKIPRPLAGFGVVGSVLAMFVSLGILNAPEHAGLLQFGCAPIFLAEISTGGWLLAFGTRPGTA